MNTPPIKVLVLLSRFPYPLEKGDKLRAFQHLKNLALSGYEVHLLALSDVEVTAAHRAMVSPFCASMTVIPLSLATRTINLIRSIAIGLPLQVGYFFWPHARRMIDERIAAVKPDVIYCQLIRMAHYFSTDRSAIPAVIDYQDAFSLGTAQRMKSAPLALLPLYKRELTHVLSFEARSYRWFREHIIISEQDQRVMPISEGTMTVLPNGIDSDHYSPSVVEKTTDVLFVGNMNYPPNIEAACFLVEEIMPIVWHRMPHVKVQIAGASPHRRVRALASSRVQVTGWVDDIRTCYASARVFVAPLQTGTGLQNKLLEAMAMAVPSVTTPISATPLGAVEGKDILVGEDAATIATHVLRLLEYPEQASQIGTSGREFVVQQFAMEHTRKVLDETLRRALSRPDHER